MPHHAKTLWWTAQPDAQACASGGGARRRSLHYVERAVGSTVRHGALCDVRGRKWLKPAGQLNIALRRRSRNTTNIHGQNSMPTKGPAKNAGNGVTRPSMPSIHAIITWLSSSSRNT